MEVVKRNALPGETLVQAVERLEALARRADRLEVDMDGLRTLVGGDLKTPAVGVIVETPEPDRHVVHVLERGGGALRVWALERGEQLPWHAAQVLVAKVVETKLTPEDKR
jgi:hypothetical protein